MTVERIKVNYKPLWKMLIDKDVSKGELRKLTGIAPSTFTKMSNNENVSLDVLVRIRLLKRNDLLPREIDNILFVLRKTGNDAAHAGMDSLDKAKDNLVLTYDLASWFMQTYGDDTYEPMQFSMHRVLRQMYYSLIEV